ncbi:hypothetical protein F5146DRAFT_1115958 [Armillaria mellea]|nr:hypothetical protein F5146DRAFT_1115958 [Armillaria mellea]
MSPQTTSESGNNSSIRVKCRYCDRDYTSKETRHRHERDKHTLETVGVQVILPNTGIRFFKCITPGCSFTHRKLGIVRDHREECYKDESDDPLEDTPIFQARETVRRDLALGRRIFPFLYDEPAGLFPSNFLSLMDWDASLDNPLVPDWWMGYLALVSAPEHFGSGVKSEQLPSDISMDTSSEASSPNDEVNAASSSSKMPSFSSTSFDPEQIQPQTPRTVLAQIEDIEMKLEAIFASYETVN